jgi:predicted nucleic acid-binding protein
MIALDTSIVVAALVSWHEHHQSAARAVERAMASKEGVLVPTHAVVEAYAVLTRLPAPHRLAPATALQLLRENFGATRLASFNARSLWPVLEQLAATSLGGGITFDAVILDAAADGGATSLLTLNERDYERLESKIRIVAA